MAVGAADILDGGAGDDTLTGGAGGVGGAGAADMFVICKSPGSQDVITDFLPEVMDRVVFVGFPDITDYTQINVVQEGEHTRLDLGDGQSVLLKNVLSTQMSEQCFEFMSDSATFDAYRNYMSRTASYLGTPGAENTLIPSDLGDIHVHLLAGNDVAGAVTRNDLLDGGDDDDTLWGDYPGHTPTPGDDWLQGGAGNDTLFGGPGDDRVLGGSGDDVLEGEDGDDILHGATGRDVLRGGDGADTLLGGVGDDYLVGGAGDDLIYLEGDRGWAESGKNDFYGTRVGGAGGDVFKVTAEGGGTQDFVVSGQQFSADNLIADFEPDQAGECIDLSELKWIRGWADLSIQNMTINGTALTRITANDGTNQLAINLHGVDSSAINASHFVFNSLPGRVIGGADDDTLTGDAGGNTLDGGAGADAMSGRTGDDTYIVDHAGDSVNELPDGGFDTVKSSVSHTLATHVENLILSGDAAIDGTGNDAANRLTGNAANNVLDGQGGVDTLVGGAGDDTYVVENQADTVIEHADEGTDTVQSSVSYTLGSQVENLTLTGTASINATGNAGVNSLVGNIADNVLDGAEGADSMAGGQGNDTYFVDDVGDGVIEHAGEGVDTVYSTVNTTLAENVEHLVLAARAVVGAGNALDNTLTGNSVANTLNGGAGNDTLDGGLGGDTLIGGTGDDFYVINDADGRRDGACR